MQGKFREGLAELDRLVAANPSSGLHRARRAQALIYVGDGDAARREARKAVEVDPKNPDAYVALGWVLTHDITGRRWTPGHDHAGARAALQQARKLDPKHVGAARQLAALLERSANGKLYGNAADVSRSLAAWRDAHALDPDNQDIADALVKILLFKGEIADAETIARSMPAADGRNSLLVAAVAAGKAGPEGALTLVSSLASGDARTKLIQLAAAQLMFARRYDEMRALYAAAPVGNPQFDAMLKSMRRVDTAKLGNDPESVARAVLISIARDEYSAPTFADKKLADELRGMSTKFLSRIGMDDKFPVDVIEDMLLAVTRMDTKRENGLARVECDQAGLTSQLYMVLGKTGARFIGATSTANSIGRYLIASTDEKASATLLDWFIEDHRRVDPKMSAGLKTFWAPNLPRTKPASEVVGAVLAGGSEPKAIAALKRCNTTVTTTAAQYACDYVLANAYATQASWSELEDHARAWSTRSKQTTKPILFHARALAHLGRFDDAEKVIADALKADPDDHALLLIQIELASGHHQRAVADQRSEALAARTDADVHDLNAAAWWKLVEGDVAGARKLADRALQIDNKQVNLLNTAAAIEAEQGDLAASHGHVEAGRDVFETPTFGDYYVHGRILEQLGLADDATTSYRKIKTPKYSPLMPDSFELATKRLAALRVKK